MVCSLTANVNDKESGTMSAIPNSNLPGHRQLHERVVGALDLCQESQDVDFKGSCNWDELKLHIARTSMAMSNLRDGGIIIIGVSERDGNWGLDGIQVDHIKTYDEDVVNDFVNRYASPSIRLELVLVEHRGKGFLAVKVPEFERSPIICKRNGEDIGKLREGGIYIRKLGKPQTTQVNRAEDIAQLLELTAEKRAKEIISVSHRIGMIPLTTNRKAFEDELDGL